MKRSEINKQLTWAMTLLDHHQIKLPPFGYWTLEEWHARASETTVIREVMLGWDITDFGQNEFEALGAVLFTLRNGSQKNPAIGTPYAEKLIVLRDGQRLPLHYHASKTEDIINRAGGILAIKLYNALPDGRVDSVTPVSVALDGVLHEVAAGETLEILPGASITLKPFQYHLFWAKAGAGDLVCGEVSSVNDDQMDNYNAEPVSRFATVEEDAPLLRPLCNEYARILGGRS